MPKIKATFDHDAGTVTVADVIYDINTIPESTRAHLALGALREHIGRAKDPAAAYKALQAGTVKTRTAKAISYSAWHQAAAAAHALGVVKADGVRPKPGKNIRDSDEFRQAYEAALVTFSPWDRDKTKAVMLRPNVVEEHARITGVENVSLAELLGAKSGSVEQGAGEDTEQDAGETAAGIDEAA